jgi:hypothetical protein
MAFLKECEETMINKSLSYIFIIITHMLFVFIFLSLAFYLFILPLTEKEFDEQLEKITKSMLQDVIYPKWFLKTIDSNHIRNLINIYGNKSKSVQEHNLWIKNAIMSVIIIITFLIFIIINGINNLKLACLNPLKIILSSLLGFIFIMIFEGFFIYKIILKYIPTKPDSFLKSFISTLNSQLYTLIS